MHIMTERGWQPLVARGYASLEGVRVTLNPWHPNYNAKDPTKGVPREMKRYDGLWIHNPLTRKVLWSVECDNYIQRLQKEIHEEVAGRMKRNGLIDELTDYNPTLHYEANRL